MGYKIEARTKRFIASSFELFTIEINGLKKLTIVYVLMSYTYNVAGSEFAALCQSQIELLTQGLGAMWSAIYLTQEQSSDREKQLLLFAIYPDRKSKLPDQITEPELPEIWQQIANPKKIAPSSRSIAPEAKNDLVALELQQQNLATKQSIVPLVYEDVMMGLLIAKREDRHWKTRELEQIKAIAHTLAIARFMEKQSQWYREQLSLQQENDRWQQEQLSNLLHQLRNPLTALRTFSKLLLKRLLPEDRNRSITQNILQQSDRLALLIDRFAAEVREQNTELPVTLSTTSVRLLEETRQPANFLLPQKTESLDVKEVIEPLLIAITAIAQSKEIKLVTEIPSDLPQIKGNASALREALNNLLDNAVKYTPSGGKITVRIEPQDNLLKISIEDTGYGIPEADREHLFERHYRGVQAGGDIPGTGLGLAIAKQSIEQMQGDIEVISPNNRSNESNYPGTIFVIWLSIVNK